MNAAHGTRAYARQPTEMLREMALVGKSRRQCDLCQLRLLEQPVRMLNAPTQVAAVRRHSKRLPKGDARPTVPIKAISNGEYPARLRKLLDAGHRAHTCDTARLVDMILTFRTTLESGSHHIPIATTINLDALRSKKSRGPNTDT